jgi:hypothetical protein
VKKPAATPLSVEELIRKKKETDAATAKVSRRVGAPSFHFSTNLSLSLA